MNWRCVAGPSCWVSFGAWAACVGEKCGEGVHERMKLALCRKRVHAKMEGGAALQGFQAGQLLMHKAACVMGKLRQGVHEKVEVVILRKNLKPGT
eukprot:1159597-Pelagomonas_calceolata.AAC.24